MRAKAGGPWPSPRSITSACICATAVEAISADVALRYQAISGCVGDDLAHEFRQWEQALDLPDPEAVLAKAMAAIGAGRPVEDGFLPGRADQVLAFLGTLADRVLRHGNTRQRWEAGMEILGLVWKLESKVRFAVSATFGYGDFTYRKPSRRQPPGGALLPRHQRPIPRVLVIADTSGSMGERDLGLALGVIARVLRKLPDPRGVEVWTGDTQVGSAQRVFRPEQVRLVGGGGTDMAVMIQGAMELPRPPDVILVATDGYTPWPKHPVKAKVVACFTTKAAAHRAPQWIEKVILQQEG